LFRTVGLTSMLLAAALAVGCGGGRARPQKGKGKKDVQAAEALPAEVVESVLRSLVVGGSPTDYSAPIRQLNSFLESHSETKQPLDAKLKEAATTLGWKDFAALEREQFTTADMDYLVDVQSLSPASKALKQTDDAAAARKAWGWVVRRIQLADAADAPAAGMYLTLLRGKGTAQSRIWIFLELLRQQGIEGAVVEGLGGSIAAAFVKGGGGKVDALLFDADAGAPILNKKGDAPATLAEAVADPSLIELTAGKKLPSPLKPKLAASIDPAGLAPRLTVISNALTGEARMPLSFDLVRWRDLAAAALPKDSGGLGVWGWATEQRLAAAGTQRTAGWDSVNLVWRRELDSPLRLLVAGDADAASKQFIKYDFEKSIDQFATDLRPAGVPNDVRARAASRARQDVIYFGGVSQMERSEPNPSVASAWFGRYLKQYAAAEFGVESILAANRMSLTVFTEGVQQQEPGPGRELWLLASDRERNAIEMCARDAAALASLNPQSASEFDVDIERVLGLIENLAREPQSDEDRQAGRSDPRDEDIRKGLKDIGDRLAKKPSAFGENLIKRHVQAINKKVNDSFQTAPPGVKELTSAIALFNQRIGEARAAESARAAAAKSVIAGLLLKLEKKDDLARSPNFAAGMGSMTGEELALLKAPGSSEAKQEAKRKLIAASFGPELLMNPAVQAVWAPSTFRNLAACRLALGKPAEAVAATKSVHASVQPIHRRELDAWARIIAKHPNWRPD
jgi:hypothetical protein